MKGSAKKDRGFEQINQPLVRALLEIIKQSQVAQGSPKLGGS